MLYLMKTEDFLKCELSCNSYSAHSISEYRKESGSIDDLYHFIGVIINKFDTQLAFTYLEYYDFTYYKCNDFDKFIDDTFDKSKPIILCKFRDLVCEYVIVYRKGEK